MKKLLKYLLLGVGIFFIGKEISSAGSAFYLEPAPNGLTYKINKGYKTVRLYFQMVQDRITKEYIYCLEPGVQLSNQTYEEWNEWDYNKFNLSKEQKDFIVRVAYYGYGYQNHTSLDYYYAAQLLIWEKIIPKDWDIYYTTSLDGERILLYQKEREDILALIENDQKNSAFENQVFEWNDKESLYIEDQNGVLKDYRLLTNSSWKITHSGNLLQIQNTNLQEQVLEFEKTYEGEPLKFYWQEEGQKVLKRGSIIPRRFRMTLKPFHIKLEIDKQNEEKEPLEKVLFHLYAKEDIKDKEENIRFQKNDKVAEGWTDQNGKIIFDNLWSGNYYLKEMESPKDYQLLEEDIPITLEKESKHIVIQNEKKKQDLILQKVDSDSNVPLSKVRFQIKNAQEEIVFDGRIDENGQIILKDLPVGDYIILEIETIEDYILLKEPLRITLNGETSKTEIKITNRKIKKVPDTYQKRIWIEWFWIDRKRYT